MSFKNTLLAATVLGGLLSASVASHASVVASGIVTDSNSFTAPAPIKVVTPVDIPRRYQNETIRLSLTIDEHGRAHNVALLASRDPALVKRLLPAVAQWQFKPAMQDGRPVATSVVLPLQLVDGPAS